MSKIILAAIVLGAVLISWNIGHKSGVGQERRRLTTASFGTGGPQITYVPDGDNQLLDKVCGQSYFQRCKDCEPALDDYKTGTDPLAAYAAWETRQIERERERERKRTKNGSTVVSIEAPRTVLPGQLFIAIITMRNTGGTTWARGGETPWRFGSQYPTDNLIFGAGRVELPVAQVRPGEEVTFKVKLKAPATPAYYRLAWAMLRETVEWFGEVAVRAIQVEPKGVK